MKFDVKMTNRIKGVALMLMLVHHFFGFSEWYVDGIDYSQYMFLNLPIQIWTQISTKICVPMFAFLTGWAYFFAKEKNYKYSFKKISVFLVNYWLILFGVVLPLYVFVGGVVPSLKDMMLNMLALKADNMVMFAWYVYFYIFTMLVLPFWVKRLTDKPVVDIVVSYAICTLTYGAMWMLKVEGLEIVINVFYDSFFWFMCVLAGFFVAKYDVFGKLYQVFYTPNVLKSVLIIIAVLICRMNWTKLCGVPLDSIYVTIVIFELLNIFADNRCKVVNRFFEFVGHHSTNVWFLHGVFFDPVTNVLQKYAYIPKVPVFVVLWAFVLCIPVSFVINFIMKYVSRFFNKIS